MSISWSVYQMNRYISHEDNDDVVYNLHWDCVAEQDGQTYRMYGTQALDLENLDEFTPYSDLTEEQVMGWLMDASDVEDIEAACQAGLEQKLNPPTLKGLPWRDADGEEEEG